MANDRFRNFSLISYIDDEELLKSILLSKDNILYYMYILHDKDVDESGELKVPHYHICLILRCARKKSTVINYFKVPNKDGVIQNCLCQVTESNSRVADYLTHKNEPNKYQYGSGELKSNGLSKFTFEEESSNDNCLAIIDDLIKGTKTYKMVQRYGREFVYKFNNYKAVVEQIVFERRFAYDDEIAVDTVLEGLQTVVDDGEQLNLFDRG